MSDFQQKAQDVHMRRIDGQSPEKRAEVKTFNENQKDWTATCRICGEKLTGSLADLRGHRHGTAS